jgi:Tat protein secretion system quality control protein TatD with DNase activity
LYCHQVAAGEVAERVALYMDECGAKVAAVGLTGLDYAAPHGSTDEARAAQREVFAALLALAVRSNKCVATG